MNSSLLMNLRCCFICELVTLCCLRRKIIIIQESEQFTCKIWNIFTPASVSISAQTMALRYTDQRMYLRREDGHQNEFNNGSRKESQLRIDHQETKDTKDDGALGHRFLIQPQAVRKSSTGRSWADFRTLRMCAGACDTSRLERAASRMVIR